MKPTKFDILARLKNTKIRKPSRSSIFARLTKNHNRTQEIESELTEMRVELLDVSDSLTTKHEHFDVVMDQMSTIIQDGPTLISVDQLIEVCQQLFVEAVDLRDDIVVLNERLDNIRTKFKALQEETNKIEIETVMIKYLLN